MSRERDEEPAQSKQKTCIVTDLDSGEELGKVSPGESLTVPLKTERARLLHVQPQ